MVGITTTQSATVIAIGNYDVDGKDVEFYIVPPARPPHKGCDTFEGDTTLCPFWWVGTTSVKSHANMELGVVTKHDVTIPALRNTCVIDPFTRLLKFKAKEAATKPFQKVDVVDGALPGMPEKKKPRKTVNGA